MFEECSHEVDVFFFEHISESNEAGVVVILDRHRTNVAILDQRLRPMAQRVLSQAIDPRHAAVPRGACAGCGEPVQLHALTRLRTAVLDISYSLIRKFSSSSGRSSSINSILNNGVGNTDRHFALAAVAWGVEAGGWEADVCVWHGCVP